ncbi:hypothetical protein IHE45_15G094500 [Dioscorea alata]|uniref:Uncharacterized protein n=1 Tax=Dioscorea alata TaxID=55571 RepID=A0ACB7UN57_DIOAL|nr:hypothetical protein IHE45_15G094500 [Dioscorea alata]
MNDPKCAYPYPPPLGSYQQGAPPLAMAPPQYIAPPEREPGCCGPLLGLLCCCCMFDKCCCDPTTINLNLC